MSLRPLFLSTALWCLPALSIFGQTPAGPKPPILSDPALKLEVFATYPDVETPTTVAAAPDGSVYIGNDPRDSRLNTINPECTVVRYSSMAADRKKTVFADKLYSPAGMAWHDGWLYVIHDPLLTRFKDTKGTGVADVREDLVTDLGQPPHAGLNDHVVSGFTLGMDGYFYISVGDKGVYHAKGRDGSEVTLWGGGIVRVRPDGTHLEVYSGGTRNHLEVDLDAMDHAFTLDNTDDGNGWWTRLTQEIESGYYGYPFYFKNDQTNGMMKEGPQKPQFWPGAPPVNERLLPAMTDFGGGSPTGGLCYMSDGLPEAYRGKLMFSEWGQRRVSVIDVVRDGATFKFVKNDPLLIEDKGGEFRPMELYVGADGSLLVSDWGFGGWKSPKQAGTVWRVTWPEAMPAPRIKDEGAASIPELIAALNHPDRDQRLRAEWALKRRGESALAPLIEALHNASGSDVQRAHALWTIDLSGDTSPDLRAKASGLIRQMFSDASPAIRAQSVRALATRGIADAAGEIAGLLKDNDAEVRLQASIALGRLGAKSAAAGLVKMLSDEDRWVRFAARAALEKISEWATVAPLLKSEDSRASEQAWLAFTSVFDDSAVAILVKTLGNGDPAIRARAADALGHDSYMPKEWEGSWWGTQPVKNPLPPNSVAWSGTAPAIAALSDALSDRDATVRLAAARALSLGMGPEALPALRARLTAETEPAVRRQLIETLGVQRDPQALSVFTKIALDEKADADFRDTAIGAVANIGGDEAKKTVTQLASAALSPGATRRVIEAVGEMKALDAAPSVISHLQDADAAIRFAAVKTLAALGAKSDAAEALAGVLYDKDGKIVSAALEAIGNMHDKRVIPALLEFAKKKRAFRELTGALASMPDPQEIPVLLSALSDKNSSVRRNAIKALKSMRAEAWPLIEQDMTAGKIPAEFAPEIRQAFESGLITKWKIMGPFENVWSAVHPPEKDALSAGGMPDLKKKYVNAEGRESGWVDVSGDAEHGHVDLAQFFHNNGMVCAYTFAEIESPEAADATLFTGSDDQIGVWLNGEKIFDFGESRGYEPDKDEIHLHLKQGKNALLVKIGNIGGSWEFAARMPGLENGRFTPRKEPAPDEKQRAFALAASADGKWLHAGNAAHGEQLFQDPNGPLGGICAQCHAIKGKGGQVGPDLSAISVNYKRPDLVTSILEPSKTIALGYEQFTVQTKGGDIFAGAIRKETDDAITILGGDQQPHIVKKADIQAKTAVAASIMPQGLTLGLKPEDFVDLLAYLETLNGK